MASPDFKVINMNTGKNKKYNADKRIRAIRCILTEKSPKLVFVQEFTWKNLGSRAFEGKRIPERFSFFGNEDSGFIYDRNYISCERLDLKSSVRRTYGLSVEQYSSELNFDLPRLCICKIKSIRPPEFELLCVSWHGPHNGFSIETKIGHLRSMLRFLIRIKVECGNLPLLLGGDFNLDSRIVKKECRKISRNMEVNSCSDSIMMWVFCSDFASTFETENSDPFTIPAFDHNVLELDLCISTVTEKIKRSIIPIKSEKPICDQTESYEYELYIKKTGTRAENRMLSVSWHGAYGEYSEEAKIKSITSTFQFMIKAMSLKEEDCDVDLSLNLVLGDELIMENIHSRDNTLDTWILSNNEDLLWDMQCQNQLICNHQPGEVIEELLTQPLLTFI